MSGINCGTYPISSTQQATSEVNAQTTEYNELSTVYLDLDTLYEEANTAYLDTLDDYNVIISNYETAMDTKAVAQGYYNANFVSKVLVVGAETTLFTNPFGVVSKPTTFYQNSPIGFITAETTTLSGIVWRTYANGVLVSITVQDTGNALIDNQEFKYYNLQSIYQIPTGSPGGSTAFTGELISSSAGMNVTVSFQDRVSNLTPYP